MSISIVVSISDRYFEKNLDQPVFLLDLYEPIESYISRIKPVFRNLTAGLLPMFRGAVVEELPIGLRSDQSQGGQLQQWTECHRNQGYFPS